MAIESDIVSEKNISYDKKINNYYHKCQKFEEFPSSLKHIQHYDRYKENECINLMCLHPIPQDFRGSAIEKVEI